MWPHRQQHTRLPCPSPSPRTCSNSGPTNNFSLCHPFLLLSSVFPGNWVFSNELALLIRWIKYWSFSFNISLFNEYSGLISFRIDWFEPLVVQENLKRFLQHHSLKASILWLSTFFMVQFSHSYTNTGKKQSFYYTDLCPQSDVYAF